MLASTDPGWLQSEFDTLTVMFDQVVLRTNVRKIVGMVCRPYLEAGLQADEAYTRRMTGEGGGGATRRGSGGGYYAWSAGKSWMRVHW